MIASEVATFIGNGSSRRSGDGFSVRCPAHDDSTPSLSISDSRNGGVVLHCHRGCTEQEICDACGLDRSELLPPREFTPSDDWSPAGRIEARYRYTDEQGKLIFEVVRSEGKNFLQRCPDSSRPGGWNWRLGEVRRPLYRLPELLEGIRAGERVFVCEGEKDVEAIRRSGAIATCNPHGAGKWRPEHTETLRDANVVVIADKDEPGQKHARAVVKALSEVAQSVRMAEAREGKDVSDHLAAGLSLDELVDLTAEAERALMSPDVYEFLAGENAYDWVVDGLLERGERLMLTGFEGMGKSTLIRQLATCCAAGIHPLKFSLMKPLRVLMIDCENGERHVRRHLAPLVNQAEMSGRVIPRDAFFPLMRPEGMDLTSEDDRNWLLERAIAHKPDIVFIGPLYNLHRSNINEELPARFVSTALNELRVQAKCALVIEAHASKGDSPTDRHVRPIGSSLWLRWPEFGYGLAPIGSEASRRLNTSATHKGSPLEFKAWRGARDERNWPDVMERSKPWPWSGRWLGGMNAFSEEDNG